MEEKNQQSLEHRRRMVEDARVSHRIVRSSKDVDMKEIKATEELEREFFEKSKIAS